jgi:hypothetical protein
MTDGRAGGRPASFTPLGIRTTSREDAMPRPAALRIFLLVCSVLAISGGIV